MTRSSGDYGVCLIRIYMSFNYGHRGYYSSTVHSDENLCLMIKMIRTACTEYMVKTFYPVE